jgi:hypothetical protein
MKVSADRKRLVIMVGAMVLLGAYALWTNFAPDSSSAPTASARPVGAAAPQPGLTSKLRGPGRRARQNRPGEWKPDEGGVSNVDPMKVDPTLRLDLLAKVQQVEVGNSQRNLFQFGDAAPKPLPALPANPGNIAMNHGKGPVVTPPAPTGPPKPPPPPQITLKYYGYSNPRNSSVRRRAFFLDGEDIIVASEGELIKKRYRLVKIGVNSVTMEDTQFKDEQTLPLAEDAIAG